MDDNCAKSAQCSSVDNPGRLRDHVQPVSAKRCACQGAFRGIKPCAKNAQDLFHDPLDRLGPACESQKTRKIYSTIPLTGLVLLVNRLCRSRGAERNSRHSVIGKAIIQAGNASLLFNRASLLRGQPRTPASPKELKGSYAGRLSKR